MKKLLFLFAALVVLPAFSSAEETAPASSIYCPNLTVTLSFGAKDATTRGQVTELQKFIADYYDLNPADYVTGYFGRLTRDNVRRFQCDVMQICSGGEDSNGWGVVGARTRAAIATKCGGSTTSLPPAPVAQNRSCTFNGQSVLHGNMVIAYAAQSVPEGQICAFEFRNCMNGTLSGSYAYASCSVGGVQDVAASCTAPWGATVTHTSSVIAYQAATVPAGSQCASQQRTCTNGTLSGTYQYQSCVVQAPQNLSCVFNGQSIAHTASVIAYQAASVPFGSQCVQQTRTCSNGILNGTYQYASCVVGTASSCTWNGQSVANTASVTAYQSGSVPFGQQCVQQTRTCSNGVLSGTYEYANCSVQAAASCSFNGQTVAHNASVTAYQASSVPNGQTCVSQQRSCSNGTLNGTYQYASCSVQVQSQSCTTPWGGTVAHNSSVLAYQASSVAAGQSCVSQTRSCSNGTLNGSYQYQACTVQAQTGGNTGSGGADGDVVMDGVNTYADFSTKSGLVYALTRNVNANTFTIGTGVSVKMNGFNINAPGGFTNSGTIDLNGQITAIANATGEQYSWVEGFSENHASVSKQWLTISSSADGMRLVAAGANSLVYTSTDGGAHWTARGVGTHPGAVNEGFGFWMSSASSADGMRLVVGNDRDLMANTSPENFDGYLRTSTDGGVTWTVRTSAGKHRWYALTSSADGMRLVAGARDDVITNAGQYQSKGGYLYVSQDGGATWTEKTELGRYSWYYGNGFASSADGMRVIASGILDGGPVNLITTNGGNTWTRLDGIAAKGIAGSLDLTRLVAVNDGAIYTSTDGGASWTSRSIPSASAMSVWIGVASSADGKTLAVADTNYGNIYISNDGGVTWNKQGRTGDHIWYALAASANGSRVTGVSNHGGIMTGTRSQNTAAAAAQKNSMLASAYVALQSALKALLKLLQ